MLAGWPVSMLACKHTGLLADKLASQRSAHKMGVPANFAAQTFAKSGNKRRVKWMNLQSADENPTLGSPLHVMSATTVVAGSFCLADAVPRADKFTQVRPGAEGRDTVIMGRQSMGYRAGCYWGARQECTVSQGRFTRQDRNDFSCLRGGKYSIMLYINKTTVAGV